MDNDLDFSNGVKFHTELADTSPDIVTVPSIIKILKYDISANIIRTTFKLTMQVTLPTNVLKINTTSVLVEFPGEFDNMMQVDLNSVSC